MNTKLSQTQIETYRRDGFLAVPGFLDESELQTWREVTDDAVSQRLRDRAGALNQDKPEDYYAQVFLQALRLADTHEGMAKLIYNAELGQMAATLAGVEGIRVWHDQALIKPPYGNPTAWHLDNPYWSFNSRDSISIWVALDDATLENGCMWYVPGTHRTARFDNAPIGANIGSLFTIYPEWKKIDPVAVPAKAGTAVFHNGLTAHGAGANMTNKPRRAMTCAFMPDGSTFNGKQNVLPNEYFKRLKIGDVIDDPKQVPLIWKKHV
jgi:hypothetical protein